MVPFHGTAAPPPSKTTRTTSNPSTWTTSGNWSNGAPDESQDSITVNRNTSATGPITFGSQVKMRIMNSSTLTITGSATFTNGATITVESGSALVITGDLTNNNNSNTITINGILSVGGNFSGGNGSAVTGTGSMAVSGTATTSGTGTVFGSSGSCSGCTISPTTPMPVDFLFFDAKPTNGQVKLNWSTAAEFNSDYFMVQHSQDGSIFQNVLQVQAAGNSSSYKEYTALDTDPYEGVSYYRLKQVDHDGKFAYTNLVAVNLNQTVDLFIYPNPVIGQGHVLFELKKDTEVKMYIMDPCGKEVAVLMNGDYPAGSYNSDIPAEKLGAGIYFCRMSAGDITVNQKIIIVK